MRADELPFYLSTHQVRAVALQMLCQEMTGSKSSINNMIGALRETGVPDRVIKAMDILRVTGNDAVHAGEMNLDEDSGSVRSLFILMNLIVDELIAKPKEIEALYMNLPSGARAAIDIRDKSK